MGNDNITIAEAVAQFLATLSAEERQDKQHELNKFIKWCGANRLISKLSIRELENYSERISESSDNPGEKLDRVKAFLSYAKKEKLIKSNLGTHLRVQKSSSKRSAAAGKESQKTISLTQEGFNELQAELFVLIKERPIIAEMIRLAAADKDFRENAPLEAARERQGQVEARIRELEAIVKASMIMSQNEGDVIKAKIGCSVIISDISECEQLSYTLVDRSEANLSKGRLSTDSPIGKAIVGHEVGDIVEVNAPAGKLCYRIEEIRY